MSDIPEHCRDLYHRLKTLLPTASVRIASNAGSGSVEVRVQHGRGAVLHTARVLPDGGLAYNGRALSPDEFAGAISPKTERQPDPAWHTHDPVGDHMPERLR